MVNQVKGRLQRGSARVLIRIAFGRGRRGGGIQRGGCQKSGEATPDAAKGGVEDPSDGKCRGPTECGLRTVRIYIYICTHRNQYMIFIYIYIHIYIYTHM